MADRTAPVHGARRGKVPQGGGGIRHRTAGPGAGAAPPKVLIRLPFLGQTGRIPQASHGLSAPFPCVAIGGEPTRKD